MTRHVVIIGAGIVGSAIAAELTNSGLTNSAGLSVTILERSSPGDLPGSTGHAPGFVGLLGDAPVLTELARMSADVYSGLKHHGEAGFDRVGGLEVAGSAAALAELERREAMALQAGLATRMLTAEQATQQAPDLVDPARCAGGLLFPEDGTANAVAITAALQTRAREAGARFLCATTVTGIDTAGGHVSHVLAGRQQLRADDVVLACGVWGPAVAALVGHRLPLVPVAHPYIRGPLRPAEASRSPFVRWPEHHVYARDHGGRLGLGTYDHQPLPVALEELGDTAEQPWPELFDDAVQRALQLLPESQRFAVDTRLNGVFDDSGQQAVARGRREHARLVGRGGHLGHPRCGSRAWPRTDDDVAGQADDRGP